jgi:Leucine-rich repeat (LRR) protein
MFRNLTELHFIHNQVLALKEIASAVTAFERCLCTSDKKIPAVKVEIFSRIDLEFDEEEAVNQQEGHLVDLNTSNQSWRENAKPLNDLFGYLEGFNMRVLCLGDSYRDFLYYGDLKEATFTKMSRWTRLASLELDNFRIGRIHASAFAQFEHLTELCLIKVELQQIDAKAFSGLEKLERLELSGNKLSMLPDGTFDCLESLRELEINSNRIMRIQPGLFAKLNKLVELNMSYNPILEPFCDRTFEGLCNLEELNLIGVQGARRLDKKASVFTKHLKKIENIFI